MSNGKERLLPAGGATSREVRRRTNLDRRGGVQQHVGAVCERDLALFANGCAERDRPAAGRPRRWWRRGRPRRRGSSALPARRRRGMSIGRSARSGAASDGGLARSRPAASHAASARAKATALRGVGLYPVGDCAAGRPRPPAQQPSDVRRGQLVAHRPAVLVWPASHDSDPQRFLAHPPTERGSWRGASRR